MVDIFIICLKNLSRKKMRSFLTIISIAIGIGSVVLISSIGEIGKLMVGSELSSLGMDGISISYDSKLGQHRLNEKDLSLVRSTAGVRIAAPLNSQIAVARMRGLISDVLLCGIDENAKDVVSMELLYGRHITADDLLGTENICIVDEQVAQAFYKRSNIIGKELRLSIDGGPQQAYIIVGIVATGGNLMQAVMGEYIPGFVYIPFTTMAATGATTGFDQIGVKVNAAQHSKTTADAILRTLKQSNVYNVGYKANDLSAQKDKLDKMMQTVSMALTVIAGVSLVVAGLGIMTVMLVSVGERTREIGIKKSIGASSSVILLEFLVEAFTLSLLGSIIGSIIGVAVVAAGALLLQIPVLFNYSLIGFCVGFSVLVGVLFGVYPAGLAAKMRPVDALRFE